VPDFRLDRLSAPEAIVGTNFRPTQAMQRRWQVFCQKIEEAFDSLDQRIADIEAAQAAADAAQADATAAAREAARINSYPNPGVGILSAADAGTDATITVANHTRVYPVQGSIDVPDVTFTNTPFDITGLAHSTTYYVYYDDTTLAVTAPTFVATTSSATAQVGAANGRHFVGYITTPASGAGGTSGGGGAPPGGGGGGSGGAIP